MKKKPHQSAPKPESAAKAASPPEIHRKRITRRIFLSGTIALFCLGAAAAAYSFAYQNRFLPRISIAGVPVGGLSLSQAQAKLLAKQHSFAAQTLTLDYQGKQWQLPISQLQLEFDNTEALNQAYTQGKQGDLGNQFWTLLSAPFSPRYYEVEMKPIPSEGKKVLDTKVLVTIESEPAETAIQLVPGKVEIVPGTAGLRLDYTSFESSIYAAFKDGHTTVPLKLTSFAPELTAEQAEAARAQAENILSAPWTVQAGANTLTLQPKDLAAMLGTQVVHDSSGIPQSLGLTLDDTKLKATLTDFATKTATKPQNVHLAVGDGGALSVSQPDQDGSSLDVDTTLPLIHQAVMNPGLTAATAHTVTGVVKVVRAAIRQDNYVDMGIHELIGTATTDFSGSPQNRVYNIGLGQRSLDGAFVLDGQVFSTTGTLGPVDESTGYKPELVIKGDRTIPEAGGGLCQVSTTLFRSVLNAGLPVTERVNHSYRVSYYERGVGPGLDATVYDPEPDFKWKNDTGHAVYVHSYIKGNQLTFELYGTKDGRTSAISTPQILEQTPPGDPLYIPSDTLYKGETKQIETAHAGAKTVVTYTVTRNGQVINQQTFRSTYIPWRAQYLVGTKDRPADSTTPTPTPAA